ncbi:MAG: hypothetical protein M3042_08820 [Actinomycetota bacterium]|nr:hypothetical protein [Actinomycetota bacterium]
MEEPVRLRAPARQLLTYPLMATALFVLAGALPPHRAPLALFPVGILLMIGPAYGVRLTEEHLVYLSLFGRHRTRWSSIRAIEVRRSGALSGVTFLDSYTAHRLPHLRPGWVLTDPDFDRKVEVLRRWWAEHRGMDWTPAPP